MNENKLTRWLMVKKLAIFQIKLAFDAIRDLFLSPVSFICGLVDIIKGHDHQHSYFRQLMQVGHKTDQWLNLFGYSKAKNKNTINIFAKENEQEEILPETQVDKLFDKIETLVKQEHANGMISAAARAKFELYLDKISQKNNGKITEAVDTIDTTACLDADKTSE